MRKTSFFYTQRFSLLALFIAFTTAGFLSFYHDPDGIFQRYVVTAQTADDAAKAATEKDDTQKNAPPTFHPVMAPLPPEAWPAAWAGHFALLPLPSAAPLDNAEREDGEGAGVAPSLHPAAFLAAAHTHLPADVQPRVLLPVGEDVPSALAAALQEYAPAAFALIGPNGRLIGTLSRPATPEALAAALAQLLSS